MQVSRLLGTSAAAAVLILAPTGAWASDGSYGGVGPHEGGVGPNQGGVGPNQGSVGGNGTGRGAGRAGADAGVADADASGGLPSTGSTALDTAIGGAGLALVLGGGALIIASRRREAAPA